MFQVLIQKINYPTFGFSALVLYKNTGVIGAKGDGADT